MDWLAGLLVLETTLEGLLCDGGAVERLRWRRMAILLSAAVLILVTAVLCIQVGQIWLWAVPVVGYRLINLLRLYRNRLPAAQLRTVSLRAFGWLLTAEMVVVVLAWFATQYTLGSILFDVLLTAQLLNAVLLLRVSTRTWRHAAMPTQGAAALSDKQLPAVSVLVPARNETDDLQRCLERLVASDYPKLEILVLDDCSAVRRTPEIIRSFAHAGVRFVQGNAPDETHWLPKNYAYEQLAREASGELLLFCGVDVVMEPHTIRQLVSLLQDRKKDMLSVLPLRVRTISRGSSLLQVMRYYWEVCLPRRLFKRPPVLSTCWLVRSDALQHMGSFASVSRSVSPEAIFARRAVVTDAYSFVRSDEQLGLYSNKAAADQYDTSVRVRYPQLHRRLELVGLVAFYELFLLLGPFIGLFIAVYLPHPLLYAAIWAVSLACLMVTYSMVAVGTRLTGAWYGWLLMPVAFMVDLIMLHISLWKYEFSSVYWKGRNVCIPVMRIEAQGDAAPTHRLVPQRQKIS